MAASASKFATVLHLETGQVLAALCTDGAAPAIEILTGRTYLPVRIPRTKTKPASFVNVPYTELTATRVTLPTEDVLDRPQHYKVEANGALAWRGEPVVDGIKHTKDGAPDASPPYPQKVAVVYVVWQSSSGPTVGSGSIVAGSPGKPILELDTDDPPAKPTGRLAAYRGSRLYLDHLP